MDGRGILGGRRGVSKGGLLGVSRFFGRNSGVIRLLGV